MTTFSKVGEKHKPINARTSNKQQTRETKKIIRYLITKLLKTRDKDKNFESIRGDIITLGTKEQR
jgi:hypothetical protein